jgi:hypothetical protein
MQLRRNAGGGEESQQRDQQKGAGRVPCEASKTWGRLDVMTGALH